MKDPRVSVVVPVFNGARYLADAIKSVVTQDYPNLECVVVDDGSTDKTPQLLRRACVADRRVRVIRQENRGSSQARNRGVIEATGDYVMLLDSDDVISPHAVKRLVTHARTSGFKPHVLIGRVEVLNEKLEPVGMYASFSEHITLKELFTRHNFSLSGVFAPRDILPDPLFETTKLGHSATGGRGCEDIDCWVRLIQSGIWFEGVTVQVAGVRIVASSHSRRGPAWRTLVEGIDFYVDSAIEREKVNVGHDEIDLDLFEGERWFWRIQFYNQGMAHCDPEAFRRMAAACALKPHTSLMSLRDPVQWEQYRMALWLLQHELHGKVAVGDSRGAQWGDPATAKGRKQFRAMVDACAKSRDVVLGGESRSELHALHRGASQRESAGDLEEARRGFERLLDRLLDLRRELDPEIGACYFHLGQIAFRTRRWQEAQRCWKACLAFTPTHRRAAKHLKALGNKKKLPSRRRSSRSSS